MIYVLIAEIKTNSPNKTNSIILPETKANAATIIKIASRQGLSNIFSTASFIKIILLFR